MNQQEVQFFLEKLAHSDYTNEEYTHFANWTENCSREEYEQMLAYWEKLIESNETFNAVDTRLIANIESGLDQIDNGEEDTTRFSKIKTLLPRIAAAASILAILSAGIYFLGHKHPTPYIIAQMPVPDIAPGGNKAILTLSNGRRIVLTNAQNGKIAVEGNMIINKTADGQIVYNASTNKQSDEVVYNTITTPKGGLFKIILPDGTKVSLNAVSSLRFPTTFNGKDRKVELTGEAYFEVVHNKASPFRVVAAGQLVEDIGTHFNINAYSDEAVVKTTLLEGSVKVSAQNQQIILKPGQQSQIKMGLVSQSIDILNDVDTEEAVAWKDGLFEFKRASVKQVMYTAARWYDLDVIYADKIPDIKITGRISRNVNLSGLINLLQFEGLEFKIEGKTITVLN